MQLLTQHMFWKDLLGWDLGENRALKALTGHTSVRTTCCVQLGHFQQFGALTVTALLASDSSSELLCCIVFCLWVACNCFALIVYYLFDVCVKKVFFFFSFFFQLYSLAPWLRCVQMKNTNPSHFCHLKKNNKYLQMFRRLTLTISSALARANESRQTSPPVIKKWWPYG